MSRSFKSDQMRDLLTHTANELLIAAVKLANNHDTKTAKRMDLARERVLAARDELWANRA